MSTRGFDVEVRIGSAWSAVKKSAASFDDAVDAARQIIDRSPTAYPVTVHIRSSGRLHSVLASPESSFVEREKRSLRCLI